MTINQRIKDALESNQDLMDLLGEKSVFFQNSTNRNYPYITFFIFDENGHVFADDVEQATNIYVQMDIWSKGDYSEIERLVKEVMNLGGFARTSSADLYEEENNIYHKAIRFHYLNMVFFE